MKPEIVEIIYTVQIWDKRPKPRPSWLHYGQRNTLEEARVRQAELRQQFSRVRIIEHKRTVRVVI